MLQGGSAFGTKNACDVALECIAGGIAQHHAQSARSADSEIQLKKQAYDTWENAKRARGDPADRCRQQMQKLQPPVAVVSVNPRKPPLPNLANQPKTVVE